MSSENNASVTNKSAALVKLTQTQDAMQLAQLCAFAYAIPQLYFCREYLALDEDEAKHCCITRLQSGLDEHVFDVEFLSTILAQREFFDSHEARLRLAPEPESFEDI
ncbi:hypothetical protein CW745_11990 [Psychromonas sp. psych-6C06]|uniref:hypothetical protein n=1 Tax=Psychromonas sp. psych-6C06 TaxID=2058089 RepID=UPI000C3215E2|nr:hypothetical protein [Psychromonas sp. psych-6C06]PKF61026.1 hypothetical protein CW745_11990 [Psychromonas sp. psych-6C06]